MPYQARFVTPGHHPQPDAAASYLRRDFTVAELPERALLHVTALGIAEPYLNGRRVGDEVLCPGWTSYRHRLPVSTHDVTDLITPGANALGVILGEGWAAGRIEHVQPGTTREHANRFHCTDRPALFLQLDLHYEHRVQVIGTDESFTCATGAVLAHSLYDGETYDARLEPRGWSRPGFPAADSWQPAELFDWDPAVLVPRTAEPVRRTQELTPVATTTSPTGKTVVDFGHNITGWVRLSVTGGPGTCVTVRHAEILTDGELDTRSLRTAKATDRYFHAGGTTTWEPRFTFYGFRYAEIDGPFDQVTAVTVHSDMPRTGWFTCSDTRLDQWHANTVRSMVGNFVGHPSDCPQRDERLGWTGDINAFGPTAAFLYDVRGVLGSWLDDVAAEQVACRSVPHVRGTAAPPAGVWTDVAVRLP